MQVLFRCDQCRYEEWWPEEQEPWLCLVCGYMRWGRVAEECDALDGTESAPAGGFFE